MRHHDLDSDGILDAARVEVVVYADAAEVPASKVAPGDGPLADAPGSLGSDGIGWSADCGVPVEADGARRPWRGSAWHGGGLRRGRVLAGLAVLALAAATLLAVDGVSAHRIAGTAEATSWPAPPPAGSCLDLAGGQVAAVPCTEVHDAEVTKAYGALDPVLAASPTASLYASCSDAARSYVGAGAAGPAPLSAGGKPEDPGPSMFGPGVDAFPSPSTTGTPEFTRFPLAYTPTVVQAPADQRVGDRGWAVCVIQPEIPAIYVGTVRGATLAHAPDAYRTCWGDEGAAEPVTCTRPHEFETLGAMRTTVTTRITGVLAPSMTTMLQTGQAIDQARSLAEDMVGAVAAGQPASTAYHGPVDPLAAAIAVKIFDAQLAWNRSCQATAATTLGIADPTYAGRLTVAAQASGGDVSAIWDVGPGVAVGSGTQELAGGTHGGAGGADGAAGGADGAAGGPEPADHAGTAGSGTTDSTTDGTAGRSESADRAGTAGSGTTAVPPTSPASPHAADPASPESTGFTVSVDMGTVSCLVGAPSGQLLTGSLVGWGDRRLPLTAG